MEWVFLKISTSTYPRISKKHGKGQTDGSGQPFQGRSLTETVWDRVRGNTLCISSGRTHEKRSGHQLFETRKSFLIRRLNADHIFTQLAAVQCLNDDFCFVLQCHFDKVEAFRFSGLFIHDEVAGSDIAVDLKTAQQARPR